MQRLAPFARQVIRDLIVDHPAALSPHPARVKDKRSDRIRDERRWTCGSSRRLSSLSYANQCDCQASRSLAQVRDVWRDQRLSRRLADHRRGSNPVHPPLRRTLRGDSMGLGAQRSRILYGADGLGLATAGQVHYSLLSGYDPLLRSPYRLALQLGRGGEFETHLGAADLPRKEHGRASGRVRGGAAPTLNYDDLEQFSRHADARVESNVRPGKKGLPTVLRDAQIVKAVHGLRRAETVGLDVAGCCRPPECRSVSIRHLRGRRGAKGKVSPGTDSGGGQCSRCLISTVSSKGSRSGTLRGRTCPERIQLKCRWRGTTLRGSPDRETKAQRFHSSG